MITLSHTIVVAVLCSVAPQQADGWGLVSFRQGKPVLLSTTHLPKDLQLRVHRVAAWTMHADVVVGDGVRDQHSALFDQYGSSANWVHTITSRTALASDALWVVLPADLTVVERDAGHAVLERGGKRVGSLEVAKGVEGMTFTLRLGDRSERLYLYLGYDIQ